MKSVKDLDVYKIAFELTVDVYRVTENFPRTEQFGLVSQMRRAAVSICSNMVEGCSRGSASEYKHFVSIAKGSTAELECQIELTRAIGFINETTANRLIATTQHVIKMLSGLKKALNNQKPTTYNLQPTTDD